MSTAPSLTHRFFKGAVLVMVAKLAERMLGLVSTLILARILFPEDFGLVAMAAPVIALVELIGAFGVDFALIQSNRISRSQLDSAWTLKILLATAVAIVLIAVAPLAVAYYREPRLEWILYWLALSTWIQGFENVGLVMFRKQVDMSREVMLLVGKKLVSLVVAVSLALAGASYWSLVAATVISRVSGVGMSYLLTDYRPQFSTAEIRSLLGFSVWVFLGNVLYLMNFRAPEAVLGRNLGAEAVALFSISYELASVVTAELSSMVARVSFPAFAEIAHRLDRLKDAATKVISGVAVAAFPAGAGISAIAATLVPVMLGERWEGATALLEPLGIIWAAMAVMGQVPYVYLSLNRPRTTTFVNFGYTGLLVVGLVFAVPQYGLQAIPWVYGIVTAYLWATHVLVMRHMLPGFGPMQWLRTLGRPLLASASMYAALRWLDVAVLHDMNPSILKLFILVLSGALVYGAVLLGTWIVNGKPDGPERMILERLKWIPAE